MQAFQFELVSELGIATVIAMAKHSAHLQPRLSKRLILIDHDFEYMCLGLVLANTTADIDKCLHPTLQQLG